MVAPSVAPSVALSISKSIILAAAMSVASLYSTAAAQEASADAVMTVPVSKDLRASVDNFWHYGKIARYELATAEGQKILDSGADSTSILAAFEDVAATRKDNLDQWLLRWSGVEAMQPVTSQLMDQLNAGYLARRSDPTFIQANIERLMVNERGYALGIAKLRQSGELAVPLMIEYLRSPAQAKHHTAIRRALRDMGRLAINPLTAATEMKDHDTLIVVIGALGDLGYGAAGPYLARLATSVDSPPTVKEAATQALAKLQIAGSPADLFLNLGEQLYYDRADIQADGRSPNAFVWYWAVDKGLHKVDVPNPIFNEIMAMRASEYALKLGGGQGDALSLWLASNYKREAELPAEAVDATRAENQPDAHYYGVSAGAQYLNAALTRALNDRNSAVAAGVIRSLQEIGGQSNIFGPAGAPLVDALTYPDRIVRYEAAFALAQSLPQQSFEGSERVVPLLAEAISQTGVPSALVVMPTQDELNSLIEGMKGAGAVNATGATSAEAAVAAGQGLSAVDVIIVAEEMNASEIDTLFSLASQNPKLAGAAKLVLTRTGASLWETRKQNDALLSTSQARDADGVQAAMAEASRKAGALPTSDETATAYATRAAELLQKLAISRGQVMDVSAARASLLLSLEDRRPEIVMLVGQTLALIDSPDAQAGLLNKALADDVGDDVEISLLNSLATSAKFFGNRLDAGSTERLLKVVAEETNLDVRSAAAEAHGALNLPADAAKKLIVDQMKV
ncbi:MAG TPA: hypothetical protein PLD59_03890 [Tepidisphaeraceae bacterium]|nr:hypothetical protein [Tepidisphaeraceae bacterium]